MLPWLLSLATAVWFGLIAHRAGRNWALWMIGGALFALAATTMTDGVIRAASIPLSHATAVHVRAEMVAVALLSVGFLGWLLTLGLHRRRSTGLTGGH